MRTPQQKILSCVLVGVALCMVMAFVSHAQTAKPPVSSAAEATMDAQRAAIWNSPNMLRARAWLLDYCQRSAKAKPGDAEKYMNELANMTPAQMNLWLMKFDEEEAAKQQQQALWQQAHQAGLTHAMAANRATQQSYAAINKEETSAANEEQQQLNTQQAEEQEMAADKQLGPVAPYGYYPGDGVHYHFHLYPY
jgi:hypothetical protein